MGAPHLRRRAATGALALVTVLAAAGCGASSTAAVRSGTSSSSTSSTAAAAATSSTAPLGERALPSFLPRAGVADGRLEATPGHPALAFQGEAVLVHVGSATVTATVVGPTVPHQGGPYLPPDTQCTWSVTLSGASAAVPLSIGQWSVRDGSGRTTAPTVAPTSAPVPRDIQPGQQVRFGITSSERVGEGLVQWAPGGGPPEAQWDYVAEVD